MTRNHLFVVAAAILAFVVGYAAAEWPTACTNPDIVDGMNGTITLQCTGEGCSYDGGMGCTWLIPATDKQQVTITFAWLDVESSANCAFDYVEIDTIAPAGSPDGQQKLAQVCGTETPDPMTLPAGHSAGVLFHSDEFTGGAGFSLSYSVEAVEDTNSGSGDGTTSDDPDACGANKPRVISDGTGNVGVGSPATTPAATDDDCAWSFEPAAGHSVRVQFTWLHLAGVGDDGECTQYVEVTVGDTTQKVCGEDVNAAPVVFTPSKVTVHYVGAGTGEGDGFEVSYEFGINGISFAEGYPKVDSTSENAAVVHIKVSEPGRVFISLLSGGSTAPTAAEVLAQSHVTGYLGGGTVDMPDSSVVQPVDFRNLDSGTDYDAFFVAQDANDPPHSQDTVTKVSFSTDGAVAAPDWTASFPYVQNITDSSVRLELAIADLGKVWWVVCGGLDVAQPTPANVVAGTGPEGTPAVASGVQEDLIPGVATEVLVSSLSANTGYTVFAVVGDVATPPHLQTEVAKIEFTTNPVECLVGEWGAWGSCSATCGDGTRARTRNITTPGPNCPQLVQSEPYACGNSQPVAMTAPNGTFGIGTENGMQYPPFASCSWLLPCSETEQLRLWFNWIDIEPTEDCSADYVTIMDGVSESSTVLARACGRSVEDIPNRVSTGVDLVVRFHTAILGKGTGFEIGYERTAQDAKVDCQVSEWTEWSDCSKDCEGGVKTRSRDEVVPATNGGEACPPLVEHDECNTQACVDPACAYNGEPVRLTESAGNITKQGAAVHFTQATSCSWIIAGGQGKTITAWFSEVHFQLCHPDGVHLFRGDSLDGEELLTACGPLPPAPVTVENDDLRVEFVDIDFTHDPSFTLHYRVETAAAKQDCILSNWGDWSDCSEACGGGERTRQRHVEVEAANGGIPCPGADELTQTEQCNTFACQVDACGDGRPMVLTNATGSFGVGTKGGDSYPANKDCSWKIVAADTDTVRVWFDWLDVEQSQQCSADYVEVTQSSDGSQLEKTCGNHQDGEYGEVLSTGSALVAFHSDYFAGGAGFSVSYEVTASGEKTDCVMSDWSDWSPCTEACGGGRKDRDRTVVVPAAHGGTPCGTTTDSVTCNEQACTNVACGPGGPLAVNNKAGSFGFGQQNSGQHYPANLHCSWLVAHEPQEEVVVDIDWIDVAKDVFGSCTRDHILVHSGASKDSGVVVDTLCGVACGNCPVVVRNEDGAGALIEFSTKTSTGTGFSVTYTVRTPGDVDCAVSEWAPWSECTQECGGGLQARTRDILVPQQGGGAQCPATTDSQTCNPESCTDEGELAATLTVTMTSDVWRTNLEQFVNQFTDTVASALSIPVERVSVTKVGGMPVHFNADAAGPLDTDLTVEFQLLPSHTGTGPKVGALVDALQLQLDDMTSAIHTAAATKDIAADVTMQVTYAAPPGISVSPAMVTLTADNLAKQVTITNTGQSQLVLSSISQYTPSASWLSVSPSSMSLAAGQKGTISVQAHVRTLSKGDYFQVINMEHNVPSAIHAIGVTLSLGGDDDGSGGEGPFGEDSFTVGLMMGGGGLVVALLFFTGLVCLVKKKIVPCLRTALGLRVRDLQREKFKRLESTRLGDDRGDSPDGGGLELKSVAVTGARESSTGSFGAGRGRTGSGAGSMGSPAGTRSRFGSGSGSFSAAGAGAGGGGAGGGFTSPIVPPSKPRLSLKPTPTELDPTVFETRWGELATLEIWGATLRVALTEQQLEQVLGAENIVCMASGAIDDMQKFYFYAEEMRTDNLYMAEVSFSTTTLRLSTVIKGPAGGAGFVQLFKRSLAHLISDDL